MDLDILRLTYFLPWKRRAFALFGFNGKMINMILPTKAFINFHTQVFNTSSRI